MVNFRKRDNTVYFSRWENPRNESSWAFKVFKKQNTELFQMYWNYISSNSFTKHLLRQEKKNKEDVQVWDFLHITEEYRSTVTNEYKDWMSTNNSFYSWTRLNVLLTLVSNFEIYISNIITVAIESNPGLLFGKADKIDGIQYLKNNSFDNHLLNEHRKKIVLETTKGNWTQRILGMKKYFGNIPDKFDDKVDNLEKMRLIRNSIAHSFGRDIKKAQENRSVNSLTPLHINEKLLIEYSGDIFYLAKSLDSFLMAEHIGSFEDLYYYHNNIAKRNSLVCYNGIIMAHLKKTAYEDVGLRSKNYWEQLIRYYYESDKKFEAPKIKEFEYCDITIDIISEVPIPESLYEGQFDTTKWIANNDRLLRDFGLNLQAIKKRDKYVGLIGFKGKIKKGKSRMDFIFYQGPNSEIIEEKCVSSYLERVNETYPYLKYFYDFRLVRCYKEDILSKIFP